MFVSRHLVGMFLLVASILVASCVMDDDDDPPPPPPAYSVAVFVDLTEIEEREGTQLEGYIQRISDLLDTDEVKRSISFYTLSDQSLLQFRFREELRAKDFGENPLVWKSHVDGFKQKTLDEAKSFVEEISDPTGAGPAVAVLQGYQQSHIIRPICEYLRQAKSRLDSSPGSREYLIIFSDLLENSPVYSFFSGGPGTHGGALEELANECSSVQGPVGIEYQVLQQELDIGNSGLSGLQFEALGVWRALFDQLGLRENPALLN